MRQSFRYRFPGTTEEGFTLKIAVACDGLGLSKHAAQCDSFSCYTVERGVITDFRNLPNMGCTSKEAVDLIDGLGFDVIITSGIDMDTATKLCDLGVEVVAGAEGAVREVVEGYVSSTLLGVTTLCDSSVEDEPEQDIDDAFDEIYRTLKEAV